MNKTRLNVYKQNDGLSYNTAQIQVNYDMTRLLSVVYFQGKGHSLIEAQLGFTID